MRIIMPSGLIVLTITIALLSSFSSPLQAQFLSIEVTNPPMDYSLCGPTQPICVTIAHGGPDTLLVPGFQGDYAPANWLFNADGSGAIINTMDAPDSIAITSGDTTGVGTATYCTTADLAGTISFDWLFTTLDTITDFDTFGYSINGGPVVLATGDATLSGSVSISVVAGDVVCFFFANDGDSLTSQVIIDNFIFQSTTDITDVKAFLTFAAGIDTSNLFTKSTTTVPVSWIPGTDSILIGDLQFGDTVRFSIDLRPSCTSGVGTSDYSVNVIYQSVLGPDAELIESDFSIGSADLSMNPTTNPAVLPVYFDLIDTIFTQSANLGNGALDTMYYCVDVNANATLLELVLSTMLGSVSIPPSGVQGNPASYTCIPISSVEWMILFGLPYMPNNSGLSVGEVWQITSCGTPDDFRRRLQYGCLGNLDCENEAGMPNPIVTTAQNFDLLVPDLDAQIVSATQPSCYTTQNAVLTLTISNIGGSPARDIIINYSSPTGYLDFTNYSIVDGQGLLVADQNIEVMGMLLACAGNAGPTSATDTIYNINLLPDSSITIVYETGQDCNCNDVSCASGGSFGPIFGGTAVITGVISTCSEPLPPSTTEPTITLEAPSVSAGISGIVEAPLDVAEGEKAVITYTAYAAELGMLSDSFPDAYIESMLTVSMGLDYVPGSFVWTDVNGLTFPGTVTYVDGGMANDMLTVRWENADFPGGFVVGPGMTFTFCAMPDCSEKNPPPGGCSSNPVFPVTITSVTKATLDPACDCSPSPTIFCPDPINVDVICTPESLGCPGLGDTCDGLIFQEFSMKRMTLGLPDDNNDRFESGVFDFTQLKLNRFLQGDSIKALFTAIINDLAPSNSWPGGFASIKLDHLNYSPLSTVVEIFDVSASASYTCNAVPVSINQVDSTIIIDFSRDALNGLGCGLPLGYEFDNGDSIAICLIFQVKESWAGPLPRLIEYDANMWVSDGPDITSDTFTCVSRRERLTQIPIVEDMSASFTPWGACDLPSWSISESRNYGVPSFDEFPFEVRPLGIPKTVVFNKPPEFAWRLDQFGISLSQPMAPSYTIDQVNSGIPSQYLIVSGDQVTFLAEQYYTDLGIPDIRPDEGYSFTFSPSVQGSCLSDPGLYDVSYSLSSAVDASVFCTPMLMWQGTQSVSFQGAAQVLVQADFMEVTVCAMTEDIPLNVSNISAPSSPNTFLAWESQNPGAISITKLRYAGSNVVITPNAFGIYQLGDIPGGTQVDLIATVRLNECGPQRLNFLTGWDCESYPTTVVEAVCADPSSVLLRTPPVGYNINVLTPLTDTILPLCDTLIIAAEIISTDLGYLREPALQVALPAGLTPIPGSFEFAYPSVTLPDFTGWEPVAMVQVIGGVRTFQLYQLDSTLLNQGLIGSKDLFHDFSIDSNAVSFRFKVATSCTFTASGAVKFTALAKSPCGIRLRPVSKSSPKISTQKLTPKFKMSFTLPNITLNPCNEEVKTLTVKGTLISGVLSPADSVLLVLPAGLQYVPMTFNPIQNFSLLPPSITTVDGSQTLAFPLAGLSAGTSFIFSVDLMGVDAQQICAPQEILVQAVSTVQDTCIANGFICGVKGLVAFKKSVATFKKPVLQFDNIIASITLDPMSGTATAIFKTRICNYGATYNAGNTITYALYDDVDANGDLTPDDTLVSTLSHVLTTNLSAFQCITVSDTIIYPAGAICTLLGVMNPNITCTCDQVISAQVKPTINVLFETVLEICSGDMIQIGPLPTINYDYEWLSVGGSSLALLSATNTTQVTFSQNNTTGADIITKYALRTSTGSCFAYDTVSITVHPLRMDSFVVTTCLNGDFSLPAPPAGGSNFNWVPIMGLSFPGPDSGFAIVDSVIASQIYNLDYIGADGCPASWIINLMAVDCGTALTALGDTVWFDFNEDGLQDPFEPGIGGVIVNLYNGSNGSLISTTVTDANGYYLFDFLPAGNYYVGFFPADGFVPTSQDAGGDDVNDSDANFFTGLTGNYYLPLDSIDLTIDAGFIPDCSLELNMEFEPCIASDSGMIRQIKFNITWDGNPYTYNQFVGQDTLLLTFLSQTVELVVDTLFGDTSYTFILGPSFPGPITIEGAVQFALASNCMAGDTQSFDECIFDLALQKVLTSATGMSYGDTLCLDVIVYNQGVQSVSNVTVVDYLPPGYLFLDVESPEWTQAGDYLIALIQTNLDPGESDTLELKLQLLPSLEPNAWLNIAEISSFEDTLGNDQSGNDIDSWPDTNPDNDAGGSVDTGSDNVIDGDGSGTPGDTNPNTDEDDQDPYMPHIFDLALIKELTTPPPYVLGQSVVFTMTVFNQGTVPAQNIVVADYIPGGFLFDPVNAPNWVLMGSTAMDTLPNVLLPGESETTTINLIIQTAAPDQYVNYAEISYAEDTLGNNTNNTLEDADSTPDPIQPNDPGGNPNTESDNSNEGDGLNGGGAPLDTDPMTDEDDQDPAYLILPLIDLTKTTVNVAAAASGIIGNFDVTFHLVIKNTGNTKLTMINLIDNMVTDFQTAFIGIADGPSIIGDSTTSPMIPTINPGYDGSGNDNIFTGLDGCISAGEMVGVTVTAEIEQGAELEPLINQAMTSALDTLFNTVMDEDTALVILPVCFMEVVCPQPEGGSFQCISDVPPMATNITEFEAIDGLAAINNECSDVSFLATETNNGGEGCAGDPLIITRTYILTDTFYYNGAIVLDTIGNPVTVSDTCVVNYNVLDDTAPVLVCPGPYFVTCSAAQVPVYTTLPQFIAAGGFASDIDCGIASFILLSQTSNGLSCPETVTRTYQVADSCGNIAVCNQLIFINDEIPPTISCPPIASAACDINDIPPYLTLAAFLADGNTVGDNCGINAASFAFVSQVSDGNTCPEIIQRTYSIADLCGNVSEAKQIITLDDEIDPTAVCCPAFDLALDANGNATLTPAQLNCGSTDNCTAAQSLELLISPFAFDAGDVGPNVVVLTVTDACGNSSTCSTIVTITGNPVIGIAKRPTNVTNNGDGSYNITYEINVENLGNVLLDSIQVTDDLNSTFPTPCSLDILEITSDDFIVNEAYDGLSDLNLLLGGDDLAAGEKGAILLTVQIDSCGSLGPFLNNAFAEGIAPGNVMVSDSSTNGSDPDPDGDGTPDETSPTPVTLSEDPYLGVAKYIKSGPVNNGDGTYSITFGVRLENNGNVNLDSLSVTDDLTDVFGMACSFDVTGLSSEEFQVNLNYDGVTDTELIVPGQEFHNWDEGEICITVLVGPCTNLGIFNNTTTANALTPTGDTVSDDSQSGSNPDPDGDGDPTNNDDPTDFELTENPVIGIAKRTAETILLPDGSADVTFEFNLENFGDVNLNNLTLIDSLANSFPSTCSVVVTSLTSDDFIINPLYNGIGINNMLAAGNDLPAGDKGAVLLTINVASCGAAQTSFTNTATTSGTSPSGTLVTDASVDGADPDGTDNDNNPDEMSPTPVSFTQNPVIGVAKRNVQTELLADGSANVTFEFNLENFGNVNLNDLTLIDSLGVTFPSTCEVSVMTLTSDDFIVDPSYDGITNVNMLAAGNDLPVGDKGAVLLTVNVANCGSSQTAFINTATAGGTSPGGTTVTDNSVNGSDPDGVDNDNNPDEESGTPVSFTQNPVIGVAKRNVQTELLEDGSANVTFEFNLENFGNVNLNDLTLIDSLGVTFPSTCEVSVMTLTSDDFIVDPSYDGITNVNMLAAGNDLPVGDKGAVLLTVNVANCGSSQTAFINTATAGGTSPGGTTITDNSVDGADPDGVDNDNNPDEESGTPVSFTQNPVIGVAKRNVQTELLADGSANVTFEFNLENFGNVNLNDLTLIDSLGITFPSTCEVTVMTLTSDDFIVDPSYDGITNVNMLAAGNDLPVGDKGAVLLTVNVANCGSAQTAFINTAEASGTSPGGTTVTDASVNGADPDGVDNDNNPDEESGTPVSFTQNPVIGVAKRNVQTELLADGSANVTFEFNLENFGNVNLNDLTLIDSLGITFPSTCEVTVMTLTSDDFIVDPSYDGITNVNMLAAGNDLPVGDKGAVLLTVNVANCGSAQTTFINTAEASGTSPGGTTVTDASVNGADPDGVDNDNNPDEESGTPVSFTQNPVIGIAKRNVQTELLADGSANVTFEFNLENFGNVNLNDLTLIDSLGVAFPSSCEVSVMTLTSDDFIVDASYDGITNVNMLAAGNDLPVGDKGAVLLTVNVANCGSAQTAFINTAEASGTSPGGTTVTDASVNGADPDGVDNDNNPDEESGTPVSFTQNPVIGVAKRNVQTIFQTDGSTNVTFEFNLENFGNVNLLNLTLVDDLVAAFPSSCEVSVVNLTSDDFIINAGFNGTGINNMLAPDNDLPVGDKGAVLLTINVANCAAAQTMFINVATATGTSPGGITVTDASVNGADPDGVDNDNNPDEESGTPVLFTPNPVFGVAKRAVSVILKQDGSTDVTYEINIENFGNVNLDSLQVIDNLAATFPAACAVTLTNLTSDDFIVNAGFNGVSDINLLALGNDLPVGDKGAVLFTINVDSCGTNMGPFGNIAIAIALSPGDTILIDTSANGADPDPNGDGNPSEMDTTFIMFGQNPSFGVAKRVVSVLLNNDGTTDVTYEINIENFGDVNLDSLQVVDDLANAFPTPCAVILTGLTSDDFVVNSNFDGVTDINLLAIGNDLPVGDKGAILFTIKVDSCGTNMGPFGNIAIGSALSPGDSILVDISANGADPDPNGDGEPSEMDTTYVTFSSTGILGIAKRLVSIDYLSNGSADMIFEFNVENFGDVDLDSLQVVDSLFNTFGSPCSISILSLTSDDFIVNPLYNGITDFEMLNGAEVLHVGDKGAILLSINVENCEENPLYPGPFENSAFATGITPSGDTIVDESVNGADPDPNGNGIPDEASVTPINFIQVLNIGLAKNVVSAIVNNDGTFSITYEFNIENFSTVVIDSIQVMDNLAAAFPGPCSVAVIELTSDDFLVNPSFDGVSDVNLLLGSDDLLVDDKGAILLSILVSNCGILGPFENNATLTGIAPGSVLLTDESVDGTDPDPNGDGIPDEESPTIVDFTENPLIGVSKRLSGGPALDDDENYVITYELHVQNYGDVDLDSIQVVDSLAVVFANAESWTLISVESEEFNVNPMFNGGTDPNLLLGNDILLVGNEGAIYVTLRIAPGGFDGPYNNFAVGTGESPFGTIAIDTSQNGSDPDPDSDGDPTNNDEVTPVFLVCFVGIICPNVPDTLYSPNDVGWCRAVFNLPPAEIITCAGAPDSLIQYMLTGQGAEGIPNNVWITGQPTGLEYIVGTTKVSMRASIPSLPEIGFSDTCMFWIVVIDKEYPVAVCQDIFVMVDGDCMYTITPDDVDGGSTDNCAIDTLLISRDGGQTFVSEITFTVADLQNPFVQVILQVTDTSGNVSICVATVTVLDVEPPSVICQDDITVQTEPNFCYGKIPVILPPILSNDNCLPIVTFDQYPDAGVLFGSHHQDSIEVYLIVTDMDGNMDTCSLFVHLNDAEAPEWLNCPRPPIQTKAMPGMCGSFVNFSLPIALDNCELDTIIQIDQTGLNSGDMFPVGTTILKWLAFDVAGNVSDTCRIKILVNDAQIPVITCLEDMSVVNDAGECGAVVNNLAIEATDNCPDNIAITYEITDENGDVVSCGITDASGELFPVGINTVTYKVYDQSIVLITEVVQSLVDAIEITNFGPSSMDLSCVTIQRVGAGLETYVIPDGTIVPPGGTYVYTFSINIAAGTPAGYILVLEDTQYDHVSTNGYNIGAGFTGVLNGGDVWRQYICDHDNSSDWVIADACHPSSIGVLNEGLVFFPDNGTISSLQNQLPNEVTCQFTVTVTDIELPYCAENLENNYQPDDLPVAIDLLNDGCASSVINVSDVFEVGHVNVIDLQITYPNVGALTVTITSPSGTEVTLFEGLCPGLQDVDISLSDTADVSVNLAPCGPLGQGGFYIPQEALDLFCEEPVQGTWTLEVSSSSGAIGTIDNWELQIFEQVPYSQQDTIIENVLGDCGAPFTWTHPIVGDNCCDGEITVDFETEDGIDVPQAGPIEGGETVTEFFEVGTTTIIYTLTDGSGNVSQCQFNVTVLDTEAPIVACPQNITINLDPGACNTPISFVPSFISDNCSIDSIYSNSGDFFDIGTHEGTIIVYDPAGNADTCTFTINVLEYLPVNNNLACNNQIQLSLPEDCTVQVGADMILEGDDYRCYENYCITIEDENGNVVPGGILTLEHVGTCVTVRVTDCLGGGNSCWGTICVELKLKPEISCPPDITVGCNQTTNVDITGEPEVLSCEQTITTTYTDDFTDNGECGEPRIFIERTWKVTDESGNFSTCIQNITVESFRFDQIEFPAHVIAYSCVDVFNNPALITPAYSGEPTINGQSIYGDHYCEIFVGYWDEKLYDANCEGSYSILRHWLIQDECLPLEEGVNPLRHIQNIQVKDNVDPVIMCPQDITVSTGNNCVAGVSLPVPHYSDICSDVASFTVQTSSGSLLHYGGNNYVLANLAIGTHTVTYKISDNCKNTVTCQFHITVVDDVKPVAICDEHTIVTLTNDGPNGVTLVPASVFDDGSWDNCGPVTFRVRRMDSCIDFDWTTEGACIDDNPGGIPPVNSRDRGTVQRECAVFACCDVGNGPVMVELEVTDIHGNVNTCMVEVEVQDKLSPFVECPPDIIVSCDFWFNVQEGTFVDAEGNGNGNLDEDPLTPIFGNMYDAFSYNDDESVRNNIIINDPGNEQFNQPHFWGIDGWADDNCEVSLQVRVRVIDDCSGNDLPANAPPGAVKLIERRFSALDGNEGVAPGTCTQRIWVVNYDPFYITDNTCSNSNTQDGVIWPCDVLITTCPDDPMGTGQPTIISDGCSLIGVTFEDTRFDFVDGACFKILREWRIIDWCQYIPQTGAGQWSYVQVIKVHDEDGPAFQDCPTSPVHLCVEDQGIRLPDNNQAFLGEDDPNASSCSVHVTLEHTIKETCSDVVFYDVKVYLFNGTDFIQLKPRTAATVDSGHLAQLSFDTELASLFSIRQNGLPYNDPLDCNDYHKVLWSVEDGCGNWSHCEYLFRLEDCKQPTPICINGLSTVVMPIGGEVTVWAKDFNASSFDDCTPTENLLYSFSGDTYEPSYTYTCDNVPAFGAQLSVDIWVADAGVDHNCNGQIEWNERNKDHCITTIVITDNAGVCPGSGSILAGEILTSRTDAVELVNVFLSHPDYVFPSYVTVQDGRFRFGSVPYNESYTITPARNDNHKNGVSTLDLVRIQKHLLGIEAFTSPYQFIAADANYNQQVSAIDMIEIRKLILGIYPTFPQNQSWRFVDAGTGISLENPWQHSEVIEIADLSSDSMLYNDFVAVKVGDVNNTAKANALQVLPRDGQRIVFVNVTEADTEEAGELVKINFTIDEQLEGFQWTLESSGLEYMGMESSTISMDDSHIGLLQDGVMTMSWNAVPGSESSGAHQQDQTFSMLFRKVSGDNLKDMIRMTSRVTESEGYTLAGETIQPQLHFGSANSPLEFALYQNEPNPWNGTTLVRFDLPEEGEVKFTVFDASGKVVVLKEAFYKPGPHSILINNKDISSNGVFYYRVDCGQYSATKKMVRIN